MFIEKIKQKFKAIPKNDLKVIGLTMLCLVIVLLLFHSDVSALFHNQPTKKPVAIAKKSSKKVAKITKPTTVAKPAVTTAPAPTVASTAPTPTAVKTSTTPAPTPPVVTPSPSSNVSGLTPTGSSGSSGSSGSGGSGSGSSGGSGSGSSGSSSPTINTYDSTNWAGYMETSGTFTGVSGSWDATNPTGNGSSESADATWIGIGGVTASDLIQIGTLNNVSSSGRVTTSAFYEMLPSAATLIPTITVNPGDSISASISESGSDQFNLTVTDNTDNQTFTDNVAYSSSDSSAEWIQEDPSYAYHALYPLDNFGSASFSDGYDIVNGVSKSILNSGPSLINLVNQSDQPVATTSSLGSSGSDFTVTQN